MRYTFLILSMAALIFAKGQNTIVITSLPESTPEGSVFFLAGSINGWSPGNSDWAFNPDANNYTLAIPEGNDQVFEAKITRGSWETVEGNASGEFLPNRTFDFTNTNTIEIEVQSWEDLDGEISWPENLYLVDDAFFMPELNRDRRIRILLPSDYFDSDNHYPVLYMQDGQNLFVNAESFAGEWEVDEAMLQFEENGFGGALIVAIDNGGENRIDEYTPWANPQYGGGEGAAYVNFIVNTLKPFIDENYRTLPEREFNGIMGSSLGGLISHYAAVSFQSVFSKVGIFSPSYWYTDDIYEYTEMIGKEESMKFYLLGGGQESSGLQVQIQNMTSILEDVGFNPDAEINFQFDPEGQHSEWFWADYFPDAFEWLFLEDQLSISSSATPINLLVYPNPMMSHLKFKADNNILSVTILDNTGRVVIKEQKLSKDKLNVEMLETGIYIVNARFEDGCLVRKVFKL